MSPAEVERGGGGRGSLALVHEWIDARAGSEQVFEALANIFPHADLFALTASRSVDLHLGGRAVRTTWLDRPALRLRRNLTLPLMPVAWRCLGSSEYDAVITSHHAFAHVNRLSRGVHLAYVHSPARYVWSPNLDARGAARYLAIPRLALKAVDGNAARRVTAYAANSREVAGRIRRFWNRDAVVIHPPVRTDFFRPSASFVPSRQYVLGVGRWIGYKNLHLVIEAASAAGLPVKIAGRGPERERLEASAKAARVPVEIVAEPTDERLRELYQNALALVFPTAEDFGLVPVEAQAAGTPVVALGRGGALDTVVDGVTGVLTSSTDVAELADAIGAAAALRSADCVLNAERFSRDAFRRRILDWASTWGVAP